MFAFSKRSCLTIAALSALGLGYGVPAAFADSVAIDTFAPPSISANGENWQVTRLGGGYSGPVVNVASASLPGAWVLASTINATQDLVSGDPGNHVAQWVSTNANAAPATNEANGQEYTYTDTFMLASFPGPATLDLTGTISSDNWIPTSTSPVIPGGLVDPSGVTLSFDSTSIPVTLTALPNGGAGSLGQETMYQYAFSLATSQDFFSPTLFTLKVNVVNSFENPTNGQNPGPTGLILAGTATATPDLGTGPTSVPLPAASSGGLVLLAGLAGFNALRRRKMA